MTGYDGHDLRIDTDYADEEAPGMSDDRIPAGWSRFDPEKGEANGDEAYIFANGHQVLIGERSDGGYYVLAYPEHGMTDLMGFVRPLADDDQYAHAPPAGDITRARDLAHGYMIGVRLYEADTVNDTVLDG